MGCSQVGVHQLRHRITIQNRTQSSDGMGGVTESWSTFATVWASIDPMKAGEVFWARHIESRVTHKVMIRYLNGLTTSMRFTFGGRTFQIKGIRNLEERRQWMEIVAEEGVPA